ncbi:YhcN/YlaJ family sporulation lipoprotein [Gottfriedia luciferensis]|uniref:YhcN/YlaJ family sporulation lipoprotein n=1 Tax=Gottfriedia luciferensis TaxID=178774 RepID=UPI000B452F34|nr:YhcN/YlaJ family sporulation lipoprotein [Gottfriedia luciferensis]
MRKYLVCLLAIFLLTGCSFGPSHSRQLDYKNVTYQNNHRTNPTPKQLNTKPMDLGDVNAKMTNNSYKDYGFSRLQKQDVLGKDGNYTLAIDKAEVANFISYLVVKLPDVDDAATLVTDQEVLIGYRSDGNKKLVRKQVEITARAALPSYYHIYTSNSLKNINSIENLNKYGQLNDGQLEQQIQELAKGFDVDKVSMHYDKMIKK